MAIDAPDQQRQQQRAIGVPDIRGPFRPPVYVPERLRGRAIDVKMITGQAFKLVVRPDESALSIRARVGTRTGIPPDFLRLIFGGMLLLDGATVDGVGIQHGSTLYGLMNLRGD
jgi:hypothetical protein